MDLSNYKNMDPQLLIGIVNTVIRNHCDSLNDFCLRYDVEESILVERLASAGYSYKEDLKQFRLA